MTLLSEFKLKYFDAAKEKAHQQIDEALTELSGMIESEFQMSSNDTLTFKEEVKAPEILTKIEKLKDSIGQVNYQYNNDNLGDDLMTYLKDLEKIVGMVGNATIIDQVTQLISKFYF